MFLTDATTFNEPATSRNQTIFRKLTLSSFLNLFSIGHKHLDIDPYFSLPKIWNVFALHCYNLTNVVQYVLFV